MPRWRTRIEPAVTVWPSKTLGPRRFAAESPWIHVDLSAASHKGGLGTIASDTTGFGVGFALEMILDKWVSG